MRVLNFCDDVNTDKRIIFTVKIEIRCSTCGTVMVYHACYEVNYKSDEIITKITILRYKCKKCDVTHAKSLNFWHPGINMTPIKDKTSSFNIMIFQKAQ